MPSAEEIARINALKRRLADADDTLSVANYKDIGRMLHRRPASVRAALPDGKKGPYSYQDIVDVRDKLYADGHWKDTIEERAERTEKRNAAIEAKRQAVAGGDAGDVPMRAPANPPAPADAPANGGGVACSACFDDTTPVVACTSGEHHLCGPCLNINMRAVIKLPPSIIDGNHPPCAFGACRHAKGFYSFNQACKLVDEATVGGFTTVIKSFASANGEKQERERAYAYSTAGKLANVFAPIGCPDPTCPCKVSDKFAANGECAAITCVCGAAFCGICGEDCRERGDAHPHVRTCKYNVNPAVYGNGVRSVVLTLNDLHKGHKMVYTDRLRRLRDELGITSQEMIDRATGHGIGDFPTDITAADLDH